MFEKTDNKCKVARDCPFFKKDRQVEGNEEPKLHRQIIGILGKEKADRKMGMGANSELGTR